MSSVKQLLAVVFFQVLLFSPGSLSANTPPPASVTVAGSLQSEIGCPGDWQPECSLTHLAFDAADQVWQATFHIPAGNFEYKAALNDSWDENYGMNATQNGPNIPLNLSESADVKFYYSHATHWITSHLNSVIAVVVGNFQSELGCPGDWQPDGLCSWLQDPDGDGIYTFETNSLPAGNYEGKIAINESWDENYGAGGVQNGPNIPFHVTDSPENVLFSYNAATHVLTVSTEFKPTVTYDGNDNTGGTAPLDPNSPYEIGVQVTVLGNSGNLVRDGFIFNGWNTAADGSGTSYAVGATFAMPAENVVLYAQWTPSVKAMPWTLLLLGD